MNWLLCVEYFRLGSCHDYDYIAVSFKFLYWNCWADGFEILNKQNPSFVKIYFDINNDKLESVTLKLNRIIYYVTSNEKNKTERNKTKRQKNFSCFFFLKFIVNFPTFFFILYYMNIFFTNTLSKRYFNANKIGEFNFHFSFFVLISLPYLMLS